MMVEASKKLLSCCMCLIVTALCCTALCGCQSNQNVINTHAMPGSKIHNLMKTLPSSSKQADNEAITKTRSGVYIYKDNSTVNTSGYKFQFREKTDIGPTEVRFDAEHFRTRF